jgi:hypothetical protein
MYGPPPDCKRVEVEEGQSTYVIGLFFSSFSLLSRPW